MAPVNFNNPFTSQIKVIHAISVHVWWVDLTRTVSYQNVIRLLCSLKANQMLNIICVDFFSRLYVCFYHSIVHKASTTVLMLQVNDTDFYRLVRSTSELIFILICANFFHSPCKRRFKGRRMICYSLDSVGIEIES